MDVNRAILVTLVFLTLVITFILVKFSDMQVQTLFCLPHEENKTNYFDDQMIIYDMSHDINSQQDAPQRWEGCPPKYNATEGSRGLVVTVREGGRLGNQIWEYISVLLAAKAFDLWPAVLRRNKKHISEIFFEEKLGIPVLEDLSSTCGLPWTTSDTLVAINSTHYQLQLLKQLGDPPREGLIKLKQCTVYTELAVPLWNQIPREIPLRPELTVYAQSKLWEIRVRMKQHLSTNEARSLEFVGVHVRRTDYLQHVVENYSGATAAQTSFYLHAMQWMKARRAPRQLAFVITSDDLDWCSKNLQLPGTHVFVIGSAERAQDIALMGACNHSIFDYGTFGLTGALLAQGAIGYTVVFNTGNFSFTKEMEFVNRLPRWYSMGNDGKLLAPYIKYVTTFVNG